MNLYRQIEFLKIQIIENENLLEMVTDHPIMYLSIKEQIQNLKDELDRLPKESYEPKVNLLFSGNAVIGSQGIKSDFLSKILKPFQEMINTQFALLRGRKKKSRKVPNSNLYLTALPVGSFGVELSLCDQTTELFENSEVSIAIKEVMGLVADSSIDDETFEKRVENTPKKNLNSLKQFLKEISDEKSVLKMESNELGIELPEDKIQLAYDRVASINSEETEEFIDCVFRGMLLDSCRYEAQIIDGKRISGFINELLSEEELIDYNRKFLNQECTIHIKKNKVKFATGREKIEYELLEIIDKKELPKV